jgi:hypothetical protein
MPCRRAQPNSTASGTTPVELNSEVTAYSRALSEIAADRPEQSGLLKVLTRSAPSLRTDPRHSATFQPEVAPEVSLDVYRGTDGRATVFKFKDPVSIVALLQA